MLRTGAGGACPEAVYGPPIDRATLEHVPFAVYVCDAAGLMVWRNRNAGDFWEESPAVGAPLGRFFHLRTLSGPDGAPSRWEALIAETLRTGEPAFELETVFERPGGEPFWALVNIGALRSGAGAVSGAIICLQNITARKLAGKATSEALELSRTISETTPECIKIASRDGTLLYMNPAGLRMVEADGAGEVLGGCVHDLIAPEFRDMWRANNERVCDGERLRWEFDIIGLRGTRRHMETHGAPFHTPGGRPASLAITRDVTKRKRIEAELRAGEQRFREVIDTALDAFIQMDETGRVIEWNPQAEAIFGWPRREAAGRDLGGLIVPPHLLEQHRAGFNRYICTGSGPILGKRYQMEALRRDGSTFTAELTITSNRRPEGGYLFNAFIRDVTEKLAAERRLQQAKKMEVMGQLTGGVAHDFNNLLMVISAGIDMIERRDDPARRRALLDSMRRATERGAGLTRQLLTFSRRQAMQPEVIDLGAHIGKSRELLDRSLGNGVQVILDIAPGLWPVEVDPGELEIAILNLAVNARDAMPNGGEIVIRARNVGAGAADADADCVRLDMIDGGVGMAPEIQARVFEPFFSTKNIGEGSGLGLAQVYGFARQSGGAAQIESAPGKGSVISLFLPRSLNEPRAELRVEQTGEERSDAIRGNVLLVEDDEQVAELVAEMLDQLGFGVTRAANARAALEALAEGRKVDLVFSDVMMPGGMNGVELAREVRRRRPGAPVVLTSGYADAVKRDADAAGVVLLPKPYRLEAFAEAIRNALEGAPVCKGHRAGPP